LYKNSSHKASSETLISRRQNEQKCGLLEWEREG
jgi:hypothetical protein